ncbi:hypothetical protein Tco_0144003 [Tanacetum coccineum]
MTNLCVARATGGQGIASPMARYEHVAMNHDSSGISCTNRREYLQGFAAALAVLITGASQSRQHIMSSASSAVTYTSVYTDSAPGRVFWGADEEVSDGGTPRVIVYGYDGLPMQPVAPPSPDYVPGPEHPASPDYVPGPEHPPSPIEIPFVPEPEYPEYLVPSEDEAPMEDQPLPYPLLLHPTTQIRNPLAQTRLEALKTVRPEPPMSASMEARIAEHAAAPTPPLPVVSSPLPLPSPLTTSPTDTGAPLGYRACLTTPAPGYEIGESSAAGAARQPGLTPAVDTWDEIVEAMMEIAPTTLEGVDQRVTELDTTVRQRTEEFEIRFEEAHDDRAYLGALVNTLYRERLQHRRTALAIDREAIYARIAWTSSEERSAAIEAHVRTLEATRRMLLAFGRDVDAKQEAGTGDNSHGPGSAEEGNCLLNENALTLEI